MDERQRRQFYERSTDPVRVLTLSDGVFAIVITLLVLEIHVPNLAQGQSLGAALEEIRPSFIAFLISFVIVAIAWAEHRDLFTLIRHTDRILVWFNILYLLPICVLPFGASLIARYQTDRFALTTYGLILVAIMLARLVIWWYVTARPHLLSAPMDARLWRRGIILTLLPAVSYLLAILIAGAAPAASLTIYAAAPFIYFIALVLRQTKG